MNLSTILCCAKSRKSSRSRRGNPAHRSSGQDGLGTHEGGRPPNSVEAVAPGPITRKPTTGLRKPGDSAGPNLDDCHPSEGFDSKEAQPNDYLYFGQPGEASQDGAAIQTSGATGKHTGPGGQPHRPVNSAYGSGRDDSGFLNTGLNNQQMGYENLTYGGSLQYDYAGTHGR